MVRLGVNYKSGGVIFTSLVYQINKLYFKSFLPFKVCGNGGEVSMAVQRNEFLPQVLPAGGTGVSLIGRCERLLFMIINV